MISPLTDLAESQLAVSRPFPEIRCKSKALQNLPFVCQSDLTPSRSPNSP